MAENIFVKSWISPIAEEKFMFCCGLLFNTRGPKHREEFVVFRGRIVQELKAEIFKEKGWNFLMCEGQNYKKNYYLWRLGWKVNGKFREIEFYNSLG